MKAVCWAGVGEVRVETVPDPAILNPRDVIVRVRATTICGSDLHLYNGYIPFMQAGDILGHEFMGEVVEVGADVTSVSAGERVVVPANISCGSCFFCHQEKWSCCDNTNPNAAIPEQLWGHAPAAFYGYSHAMGGYAGSQADYVRIPYADVNTRRLPDSIADEQALFLSDAWPTAYTGVEFCEITPGDTVAQKSPTAPQPHGVPQRCGARHRDRPPVRPPRPRSPQRPRRSTSRARTSSRSSSR